MLVSTRIAGAIALFSVTAAGFAGELDPPAGPVNPTMKDLDDVSPRQIIRNDFDTLTPIVISEPGSYYLGEDILGLPNQHGIEITASNVTLDLNGFRVEGNTEVGALDGIVVTESERNVTIRNGSVIAFNDGLDLLNATGSRVVDVHVFSTSGYGIRVGAESVVIGCRVDTAGLDGILLSGDCVAERCVVIDAMQSSFNASGGSVIRDCIARDGDGQGFSVSDSCRLESCFAENFGAQGFVLGSRSTAANCVSRGSGGPGFSLGTDNILDSCIAEDSQNAGFLATFGQAVLNRCVAGGTNGRGFDVGDGSVLMDCEARENAAEGFLGEDRTQYIRCAAMDNGPSGLRLAGNNGLIRDCSAAGNSGFGINIQGSGNVIVGNVVTAGDGYNIGGGNTAGTLQANPSIAGPWDNLNL